MIDIEWEKQKPRPQGPRWALEDSPCGEWSLHMLTPSWPESLISGQGLAGLPLSGV